MSDLPKDSNLVGQWNFLRADHIYGPFSDDSDSILNNDTFSVIFFKNGRMLISTKDYSVCDNWHNNTSRVLLYTLRMYELQYSFIGDSILELQSETEKCYLSKGKCDWHSEEEKLEDCFAINRKNATQNNYLNISFDNDPKIGDYRKNGSSGRSQHTELYNLKSKAIEDNKNDINEPDIEDVPEVESYDSYGDKREETDEVFEIFNVSEKAEFPGGEDSLQRFIQDNLVYPPMAKESKVGGTVTVMFIVNYDGNVIDVKSLGAKKGYGLEEEAKRLIMLTSGLWTPGMLRDKAVSMRFRLPIKFELDD